MGTPIYGVTGRAALKGIIFTPGSPSQGIVLVLSFSGYSWGTILDISPSQSTNF